jgi:predicted phage gp36 major capsid-like protein
MSLKKAKMEARAAAHSELVKSLAAEQTAETREKVTKMLADIEAMSADIANIERADKMAAEFASTIPVAGTPTEARTFEEKAAEYRKAYSEWLCRGDVNRNAKGAIKGGASTESIAALNGMVTRQRALTPEQRDQQAGTQSITYSQGTEGGYFVPTGFVNDIEKATKFFAPLMDGSVIKIMETATGQLLPYPTSNDTKQAWKIVGENVPVTTNGQTSNYDNNGVVPTVFPGDVLASVINFNAFKGTTGLVKVSLELLQDSAFSIESFLTEAFAIRLGRGYEAYLTNGTGSTMPTGLLPAIAASGAVPVIAAGSSANDGGSSTGVNSIGYADLVNLTHAVDPSYRNGARFMLHDLTLAHLKTRLDKYGRPLWVPAVKDGEPDTLCGYRYVINQSMPTIAASATTVAFGAFQKFMARKVRDLQVLRLDERYAEYGQVAYIAFSRIDSNLLDAGTHPINVLQQHS